MPKGKGTYGKKVGRPKKKKKGKQMATDFKYASQSDLEMYYPQYSQFDAKRQLYGWTLLSSNKYIVQTSLYTLHIVTNTLIDYIQ